MEVDTPVCSVAAIDAVITHNAEIHTPVGVLLGDGPRHGYNKPLWIGALWRRNV